MKILITSITDSGILRMRSELIQTLVAEGNSVVVMTPPSEAHEKLQELGCAFLPITIHAHDTNPWQELQLVKRYKEQIQHIHPDIVLTYTIKPNIYGGLACANAKWKIPYVANVTGLGTAVENGGIMQKITLTLYKRALRKARKVFFQNTENRDFMLKRHIVKGGYEVIPGSGVNLERNGYEEYPQDDGKIVFLFAGRLMKDKGVSELVQAAERIEEKYENVRFEAVGFCEPEYEKELKDMNAGAYVSFAGEQRNVHEYMKRASAVILPSYHEGMSNSLLEAAACGRPILASDIPGCRETFDEGISGFGFRPRDVDSLCETIEKFIALPYEKKAEMGRAGRAKMEREFDRRIVVEKYMEVIREIQGDQKNVAVP